MQRRGIVTADPNPESCWVMENSRRETVNSPWSSRLNMQQEVGPDGDSAVIGKDIIKDICKEHGHHELEWYRARIEILRL